MTIVDNNNLYVIEEVFGLVEIVTNNSREKLYTGEPVSSQAEIITDKNSYIILKQETNYIILSGEGRHILSSIKPGDFYTAKNRIRYYLKSDLISPGDMEQTIQQKSDEMLKRGKIALLKGNYRDAKDIFLNLGTINPGDSTFFEYFDFCRNLIQKNNKNSFEFEEYNAIDPEMDLLKHIAYARFLKADRQFQDALVELKRCDSVLLENIIDVQLFKVYKEEIASLKSQLNRL